jgi:excisionase family DNA binding protein
MKYLTRKEVQEKLRVSLGTINNWKDPKKMHYPLPSIKIGRRILFAEDQVDEWAFKFQNKNK